MSRSATSSISRGLFRCALACALAFTGTNAITQDATAQDATIPAPVVSDASHTAIRGGLKYLVSTQQPNGGWSANGNHQTAMTGYAVIAFLATGSLPGEGEHGAVVQRGVDFLLSCVKSDGYIVSPIGQSNMYNHGIATLALSEVYGHTRDLKVRPALERAVNLILKCQNDQGGWRYGPRKSDADISVTVIQLSAIRAAKNAGLDVPQETLDRAVKYIHSCHRAPGFLYQPGNGGVGFSRTAAAIYSLQVCGLYDDPTIPDAADYLVKQFGREGGHATYGHFYAGPALYMIGGAQWNNWYARVVEDLHARKTVNGDITSWQRDGKNGAGEMPVFYTAVNTTLLALPLGYLPLYQR